MKNQCPNCGADISTVWSWPKFFIGKLSNKLLAWAVYMVFQFLALLHENVPSEWTGHILIISGAVTFIFMLAGAIDVAVSNAKITAELNALWEAKFNKAWTVDPKNNGGTNE